MRNRPTSHVILQVMILVSSCFAYLAILSGAHLRGYAPSLWLALRDWVLLSFMVIGFWVIIRRLKYRGSLGLYTSIMLLFSIGLITQYRLFSDPEYTSRGSQRTAARRAKAHSIRSRAIREGYDQAKLEAMLGGDAPAHLPMQSDAETPTSIGIGDVLFSARTTAPLVSLLGLIVALVLIRKERVLLWLQQHSVLITMAALVPLMIIIIFFTRGGKFVGGMTPWEPAKLLFLFGLAGILVDSYHVLGKTRWGLPPLRYFAPLVITASFALIPFFVLGDFGQLLVFGIVYALVYLVAVKRPGQVVHGMAILVLVFFFLSLVKGIPSRVQYRFHLWEHTWSPPAEDAGWWVPYLTDLRSSYGPSGAHVTSEDGWFDLGSQVVQAIFGVTHGRVLGTGLGLGLPETVPVSDSDFIYAAIAEELGMVGGGCLLLVILVLGAMGWREAIRAPDMYTKLVAAGVTAFLVCQAWVNIAGVVKLTPMTGITLPFVSHGGWSLLTSFTMGGILMGISHRNTVQSS